MASLDAAQDGSVECWENTIRQRAHQISEQLRLKAEGRLPGGGPPGTPPAASLAAGGRSTGSPAPEPSPGCRGPAGDQLHPDLSSDLSSESDDDWILRRVNTPPRLLARRAQSQVLGRSLTGACSWSSRRSMPADISAAEGARGTCAADGSQCSSGDASFSSGRSPPGGRYSSSDGEAGTDSSGGLRRWRHTREEGERGAASRWRPR
mmetsp:Transcript_23318/g.55807  ORF Transcript_23318/g.55807 Transcript_23318/m.55807 type:complete len:207 (-) Transcript_23318:94-714(-)